MLGTLQLYIRTPTIFRSTFFMISCIRTRQLTVNYSTLNVFPNGVHYFI